MAFKAIFLLLLLAVNSQAAVTSSNYWKGFSKLETLFVFGDSWSRTGFNPSGEQPSRNNRLGNPPYPGVTSANGPNWVGYLTTAYNKSPFLTYNFGYSGAVVDKSIVNNNGHDIHEQVYENFLPRYKRDKKFHSSTSLFAFWIGINDLMHADLSKWSSITDRIFKSYGKDIEALYKAGARNFVLLTLPPLQYAPRITNQKDEKRMRAVADAVAHWNSQIKALQKRIEKSYSKTTVFVFDTYPLFLQVIEKPSAFKETSIYKNTDNYCKAYTKGTAAPNTKLKDCKYAADQYLWLNNLHPTSPLHKLVAKSLSNFLQAK